MRRWRYGKDIRAVARAVHTLELRRRGERSTAASSASFRNATRTRIRMIIERGAHCFVIMNAYPYNPGHLMVVPYRHTADFTSLTAEEFAEMTALAQKCVRALTQLMQPHGFNIGMNIGKVAGAGIDQHHAHARRAALERRHELHARHRRGARALRVARVHLLAASRRYGRTIE